VVAVENVMFAGVFSTFLVIQTEIQETLPVFRKTARYTKKHPEIPGNVVGIRLPAIQPLCYLHQHIDVIRKCIDAKDSRNKSSPWDNSTQIASTMNVYPKTTCWDWFGLTVGDAT